MLWHNVMDDDNDDGMMKSCLCVLLLLQLEWSGRVIPVSWSPRAFLFKDFLTDEECDHLTATVRCG